MEYSQFLSSVEPVTMGLDGSTISLDRDTYWEPPPNARRAISSRYELTTAGADYFDIEASFSVVLEWTNDAGAIIQPLKIECVFSGHFHAATPLDREHAKKFAETESWLLFWPFFRHFVVDATARMAIPPVIVPLGLRAGQYSTAMTKPTKATKARSRLPSRKKATSRPKRVQ